MKIKRNLSTKKNREFWDDVDQTSALVGTWPGWKKISVSFGGNKDNRTKLQKAEDRKATVGGYITKAYKNRVFVLGEDLSRRETKKLYKILGEILNEKIK